MSPDTHLIELERTIQLAIAPVFLLTAIGTILGVLAGRLGRVVDRAREIEDRLPTLDSEVQRAQLRLECTLLHKRRHLINYAITCITTSALLVCLVVAFAFVGFIFDFDFSNTMAVLFVGSVLGFILALVLFLREILHAVVDSHVHTTVL